MPTVSVIIPNYNHAHYLQQRIDSVLNQTYQDIELILLDDCSTDNSQEIILSYSNHPKVSHVLFNKQNSGSPFKQWNKGIELAKGEYVWIAESDDWADSNFLEYMLFELNKFPNVGLAYAKARYMHEGKEVWKKLESEEVIVCSGTDFIKQSLIYTNVIYNVSMTIFKRNLYKTINHDLYKNMRLCGDWFFYVLLCENTDILQCNKQLSNYRLHHDNTSLVEEKLGKSLLEGIEILEYIRINFSDISKSDYSFFWAKQWAKYSYKFRYSKKINLVIRKKMIKHHKLIVFYFTLYRIYYRFKRKIYA